MQKIIFQFSFVNTTFSPKDWMDNFKTRYSGLSRSLPSNIHVLTLETKNTENKVLLRLENFFENGEDSTNSKPDKVKLKGLFTDFDVLSATEMNLSANQLLKEKRMWQWKTYSGGKSTTSKREEASDSEDFTIWLNPMDMRTFLLDVKYIEHE